MAPVTLVVNPDGCKRFESNAFKKEKCKHCGRHWSEHKGAIDDKLLQGFLQAEKKKEDDKLRAAEAERQKAAAKQAAKKKKEQAVEDEWLFDGQPQDDVVNKKATGGGDDSDDDMGFNMFIPPAAAGKGSGPPAPTGAPPAFKVVNLIDFGECDVAEETQSSVLHTTSSAAASAVSPMPSAGVGRSPSGVSPNPLAPPQASIPVIPVSTSSHPLSVGRTASQADLQAEIEDLRQMLADANAEKSIQVAIVQDEVVEKQKQIDEMKVQIADANSATQELRKELEAVKAQQAAQPPPPPPTANGEAAASLSGPTAEEVAEARARAEQLEAELAELRRAASEHTSALEASRAAASATEAKVAAAEAKAAQAEAEATAARAELQKAQEAEEKARKAEQQARQAEQLALTAERQARKEAESSKQTAGQALSPELGAELVAKQMSRHAAQALRELRLQADEQLAWLTRRIVEDQQNGDLPGQPVVS